MIVYRDCPPCTRANEKRGAHRRHKCTGWAHVNVTCGCPSCWPESAYVVPESMSLDFSDGSDQ